MPLPPGFLQALREVTARRRVILIFDEVITGFRFSPGGAQQTFGITADLCTLAKIVAGGLPGGALAGRRDIMEGLDFAVTKAAGRERVAHQGTYNANPLCAAAGVATLEKVASTDACARASGAAANLRAGMNEVLAREGVPWAVYGDYSLFHVFTNPSSLDIDAKRFDPLEDRVRRPEEGQEHGSGQQAASCHADRRRGHHGRTWRNSVGHAWRPRSRTNGRGVPAGGTALFRDESSDFNRGSVRKRLIGRGAVLGNAL